MLIETLHSPAAKMAQTWCYRLVLRALETSPMRGGCEAPAGRACSCAKLAYNVSRICVFVAFTKLYEPHGFAAFGLSVACVGCLTV